MKKLSLYIFALFFILSACKEEKVRQRVTDFNFDWKFSLENNSESAEIDFDDSNWRDVRLPHDWSIEAAYDSVGGEGATGYLPGGIGWYRKNFKLDLSVNEVAYIYFDGIYNNSEVWLNGKKLGDHPYGYSPFYFDITSYLNEDKENVMAVKVDHSRYVDSRWYTGSGIYRNVNLIVTNKLHIPVWGTFVTTPEVSEETALVKLETRVKNCFKKETQSSLKSLIMDCEGRIVAHTETPVFLQPNESNTYTQSIRIENPELWDVETPNIYKVISTISQNGQVIDKYETPLGIRSIKFDKDKGFFLNGKNMKIKGVCLHHDAGLVGAAVPKGVWKRRLQKLKDGGCNAIRISHNPASEEFLELCDEMGLLVQDEFFDEWDYPKDKRLNMQERHDDYISRGYTEHFQEWAEKDLKATMLAHRNHPSIFQWSIGNEIEWTYPRNAKATGFFNNMDWSGNYFWSQPPYSPEKIKKEYNSLAAKEHEIGKTAKKLAAWTREMDVTRPVIANCILPSASLISGYADALDIVGFSYRRVMYDYAHKNYPHKTVMGTENLAQWHEWKAILERPFVSGTFLWTGFDYMGESNKQWPRKATPSGLMDLAAYPKPSYHMYKSLWSDDPHIYMCSNTLEKSQYKVNAKGKVVEKKPGVWKQALWFWYDVNEHWNYKEGEGTIVEVISNCPEVELFLNDQSLGVKKLSQFPDRIFKWHVPFSAGKLTAKGVGQKDAVLTSVATSNTPVAVTVEVDKTKLKADGYDVSHICVQLVDGKGNPVRTEEKVIEFNVTGSIKSLGVDNGHATNVQTHQATKLKTYNGRGMIIVQSLREEGVGAVTISGPGIKPTKVELKVK